jgi:hypothetical protein
LALNNNHSLTHPLTCAFGEDFGMFEKSENLSLYEKNGVKGEIWRPNHDKFHIPWKTERLDTWLYGLKIMINTIRIDLIKYCTEIY